MRLRFSTVVLVCIASATIPGLAFARGGSIGGGHSSSSYHFVSGYAKSNGTYVAPHAQTNANGTKYDNWSTKGNVNPFTGQEGTKNPD